MLAVHSQHIHAEVTGWRTPKGLLLREPVKASFTYTPALAKSALLPQLIVTDYVGTVMATSIPIDAGQTCYVSMVTTLQHFLSANV